MTETALRAAEAVVGRHAGLRASAATEPRLASSLRERARARDLDIETYVDRLAAEPDERQALLDLLTVQETSWFRDAAQIDAFIRHVVPRMEGTVTVWSAGCSTGQEPYSLAMALDEAGVDNWRVVASDVALPAVARTRAATYRPNELRGLSSARTSRYLRRHRDGFVVDESLRERVLVMHHNLATEEPPVGWGTCAAVFCRNVFIYLCRDRIQACLASLAERLAAGGVMFLGASETLVPSEDLDVVRFGDVFAYERRGHSPAATSALARTATAIVTVDQPSRSGDRLRRSPMPSAEDLRREGESASRRGDHRAAAAAFRKAIVIDPNDVAAHLGLGFSLEALGQPDAGRRALVAARDALDRVGADEVGDALEGYAADAVRVVLAAKLGGGRSR